MEDRCVVVDGGFRLVTSAATIGTVRLVTSAAAIGTVRLVSSAATIGRFRLVTSAATRTIVIFMRKIYRTPSAKVVQRGKNSWSGKVRMAGSSMQRDSTAKPQPKTA
jgi:hypothetical protein